MPRVKKKRGKLGEIKEQRRDSRDEQASHNAKRRKLNHGQPESDANEAPYPDDQLYFEDTNPGLGAIDESRRDQDDDTVFYGLLDESEQAYYANVNAKITSDDFEDAEEKVAFIDAVFRESRGKELKLSSSQACSRHIERLLAQATEDQLKVFFSAIMEGLTQLVQHRFGSHVCETLFRQSAKHVPTKLQDEDTGEQSLANLLLKAAEELKKNIGFMLTDRFASHVTRVLLLVLSGEPLEDAINKGTLTNKRKENAIDAHAEDKPASPSRKVPKSFLKAMTSLTAAAVATLDSTYLRALATHPTGNPVLQLLLRLELKHSDKGRALDEKSLFHRLVAPETLENEDSEGAKFVTGLTYDPTGSRLIEVLVDDSPGKVFKKLYKGIWKDRMPSLAKNEIASYVAIKIIVRLGKDELLLVRDSLLPELDLLIRRRRFSLIKTLIDRSVARELEMQSVAKAFDGLATEDPPETFRRLMYPDETTLDAAPSAGPSKADVHGSLLIQAMLEVPELSEFIQKALSSMNTEQLLEIAQDTVASRALQTSLMAKTAGLGYKKHMVPKFYGHVTELATGSVGSYLADALWEATNGLHFMKERLANEMANHESELRNSYSGRKVWGNWSMDIYGRRRGEWHALAKGVSNDYGTNETRKKTPIELARQRRAEQKAKAQQQDSKPLTAANA